VVRPEDVTYSTAQSAAEVGQRKEEEDLSGFDLRLQQKEP
jgi:hypothetical protein